MREGLYLEMNLERLVVPESKEELKNQNDGLMSKGHRSQLKEWPKLEQFEQENYVTLL